MARCGRSFPLVLPWSLATARIDRSGSAFVHGPLGEEVRPSIPRGIGPVQWAAFTDRFEGAFDEVEGEGIVTSRCTACQKVDTTRALDVIGSEGHPPEPRANWLFHSLAREDPLVDIGDEYTLALGYTWNTTDRDHSLLGLPDHEALDVVMWTAPRER